MLHARTLLLARALFTLAATIALGAGACDDNPPECTVDTDCGAARVCAAGRCVACADNTDCGAGQFCCNGACQPDSEIDRRCGCGPAEAGNPGTDCTGIEPAGLCLVGDATATVDTVGQGSCGCGCSAAAGGPICGVPAEPGQPAVCSCAENSDCRVPSADAAGIPHRSTDTCTPGNKCVCFTTPAPSTSCGAEGAAPDCSSSGCVNLLTNASGCGVAGRSCLDPANSLASGGTCVDGGCTCDAASDCQGAGLNVDACVFVGDSARCVCSGYTRGGAQAACPMELGCAGATGCSLDGVTYTSEEAMRTALGLP